MTKNAAFTLIELLISIFIITILLSASFAGYAKLNQRQTLIAGGQNLKNFLRDAQTRAVNTEIDCNFCNCTTAGSTAFNGWTVDFDSKSMYGSCGETPTPFPTKSFNLSSDIIITPYLTPANQLVFKNNPPGIGSNGAICVSHVSLGTDVFYVIRVKETGAISDGGGLVNTCP